jgi:hypothetical protein
MVSTADHILLYGGCCIPTPPPPLAVRSATPHYIGHSSRNYGQALLSACIKVSQTK